MSLLLLPTYNIVTSDGTGVFVLNVDNDPRLKELARKIAGAVEKELANVRERLGRGVREELERYEKFEQEITRVLDRFDVDELKEIARRNFPDIYPAHIDKPDVYDKHPALWHIYKLTEFVKPVPRKIEELTEKQRRRIEAAARKTQEKFERSKKALMGYLSRTKEQFTASQRLAVIVPTKTLHITLCGCGVKGCSKPDLKQLFSKFYDTPTQSVELTIEEIAVYDDGPGWIVLNIRSSYLDRLVQRLRKNNIFQCTVRTPFRAHISVLRFDGFERGQRNTVFQLFRDFLIKEEKNLLAGFDKPYCIDIKEFGIKEDTMEFL